MFTERAREAIGRAQVEAREMGHRTVEVEHLLLGLFSDHDGIAGEVFADFGLTIERVRELVRERLGVRSGRVAEGNLRFLPEAKDVLSSANRIALGKPGTEHVLIMIVVRDGGACELLRVLGADPHRIWAETKKRAYPSSVAGSGAGPSLRLVGVVPAVAEIDFGD